MPPAKSLTVFYDGACPLCEREIGFYRRRKGAAALHWVDVSEADDGEVAPGLFRDEAMARFHVRDEAGDIVSGGEAFARLWQALPGFRPVGRLFSLWPLTWLINGSYDYFLRFRPRLQRLAGAFGGKGREVCEETGPCSSNPVSSKAVVETSPEKLRKSPSGGS
ncbi:thiol-disulfide oxidoreductase DCC family protein [Pelagibius litoralis]|uniref:thiol-disulfide oxidoreductase DCC family protein n=1 Tax=Pelagibius litoralis TaxID=374515 RepID=UPI00197E61BE|nr:DUF393 domain-containing protein [Pelagibius litoralis]